MMNGALLARMDDQAANRRILERIGERADFRRVEEASIKRTTRLSSPTGKRILARCFYSLQLNMWYLQVVGSGKLPEENIEQVETLVRKSLDKALAAANRELDAAHEQLRRHAVETVATYDAAPLELEVSIVTAHARKFFELLHKVDEMMPLIQTLAIEEIIDDRTAAKMRTRCSRMALKITGSVRMFAIACRKKVRALEVAPPAQRTASEERGNPDDALEAIDGGLEAAGDAASGPTTTTGDEAKAQPPVVVAVPAVVEVAAAA